MLFIVAAMSFVASAVAPRGQRITGSPHPVRLPGSPSAKLGPALERLYKARGAAQDAELESDHQWRQHRRQRPARVDLSKRRERIVILLGGGGKKRQSVAIAAVREAWAEYRRRKGTKE